MHDKLDIIWNQFDDKPEKNENSLDDGYNKDLKQYDELINRRNKRFNANHQQIDSYNKMLDLIDKRLEKTYLASRSKKTHIHEKEREFFDAIRLIIQNGY